MLLIVLALFLYFVFGFVTTALFVRFTDYDPRKSDDPELIVVILAWPLIVCLFLYNNAIEMFASLKKDETNDSN